MNESLSADILQRLAENLDLNDDVANELILATIAMHKNTPVDVLNKLAIDSSNFVKSCILLNLNTPKITLEKLQTEIDFKNVESFGSLNWWDTPSSNWANISGESKAEFGFLE
jgi:hypothetical protein